MKSKIRIFSLLSVLLIVFAVSNGGTPIHAVKKGVAVMDKCSACNGSGLCSKCLGSGKVTCAKCGGAGSGTQAALNNGYGDDKTVITCPSCHGKGSYQCSSCNGTGNCRACNGTGKSPY